MSYHHNLLDVYYNNIISCISCATEAVKPPHLVHNNQHNVPSWTEYVGEKHAYFHMRTAPYGDVVIEHVDFYGSVHTHCVAVRRHTQCKRGFSWCRIIVTIFDLDLLTL